MSRIALLGGGFSTDADGVLDDWLLGHARAARPKETVPCRLLGG
ncbi:hypothetical protein [Streptomyces sp. BSE7-9]|nr:hypothetical protein [Streptomyces sp. BSE7-9]